MKRLLLLLFAFAVCCLPLNLLATGIALVNHGLNVGSGGVTTSDVALTGVTAGNLLIVGGVWCDSGYCNSESTVTVAPSDTFVSSFTACPAPFPFHSTDSGTEIYLHCWYGVAAGSGNDTIRVTASATVEWFINYSTEWSGAGAFDTGTPNAAQGTGTTASVTTAGATAVANELIFILIGNYNRWPSQASGYTWIDGDGDISASSADEYQIGAAIDFYTAAPTFASSTEWAIGVITFKPAGGAPTAARRRVITD